MFVFLPNIFNKMTKLSVNINKIATLRNARGGNTPNLLEATKNIEKFGAQGITVHPRPDQRHITYSDIEQLAPIVSTEFNIEGNPTEAFISLVLKNKPTQVTLVPDAEDVLTSNAGWDTIENQAFLKEVINEFQRNNIRTSIFVDPKLKQMEGAKLTGTDRIEFYTESYAKTYPIDPKKAIQPYQDCALIANQLELGINAGHDLSLENIQYFKKNINGLLEVSIGHALISESLYLGLQTTIKSYLEKLN